MHMLIFPINISGLPIKRQFITCLVAKSNFYKKLNTEVTNLPKTKSKIGETEKGGGATLEYEKLLFLNTEKEFAFKQYP